MQIKHRTHTWRDLADGGRVPAIALVTVGALNKDGAIAETLRKHFSSNVIQPHSTALRSKQKEPVQLSKSTSQGRHT